MGKLLIQITEYAICVEFKLLDVATNCAKADEPIKMPFRVWTRMG